MKPPLKAVILIPIVLFTSLGIAPEHQRTAVTPHLNVKLTDGDNVVYSSSFHLAWKMLQNDILKEDVRTERSISYVADLNSGTPAYMDDRYSVNMAGFVSDGIQDRINEALGRKFNMTVDLSPYTDLESTIICYSLFKRRIQWRTKFETFDQAFPFYSGGNQYEVECFGVWTPGRDERHQARREMVRVIDFTSTTDFIISIGNPDEDDEVIVAVCRPRDTFGGTIDAVCSRIHDAEPTRMADNDRLIIPKIMIDVQRTYDELYGAHLLNATYEDYFFTEAVQEIAFELNESGAVAGSEAILVLKKGPGPRTMIVNRPFLIMMRNKALDAPFLAAWISHPELLVQAK